jgi:hypothetical protein
MKTLKIANKWNHKDAQEKLHIYKATKFACLLNKQYTKDTNVLFNLTTKK